VAGTYPRTDVDHRGNRLSATEVAVLWVARGWGRV